MCKLDDLLKVLREYLKEFASSEDIYMESSKEQLRSVFTTICLLEGLNPDTEEADSILIELFDEFGLEDYFDAFEEFTEYMYCYLV